MKIKRKYIIPALLGILLVGCDKPKINEDKTSDFTVEVKNNSYLKLFQHVQTEEAEETSHLSIDKVESITSAYSYKKLVNEYNGKIFEKIHDEKTDSDFGNSTADNGYSFFKYTFYVKNTHSSSVSYNMFIELKENIKPIDSGIGMDEYLRLMVFEGDITPVIYARRSKSRYDETHETYKEYVCGPEGTENYFGEAELFESDTILATYTNSLKAGEYRMYTLLFWLEAQDNECNSLPDNTYIKATTTFEVF